MSIVVIPEPARELEGVFREHARLVYRTAFGVTGSHEDAEDVLQTIFLRLIRQEFPPDLKNNPQAYLYRAAVNASLNIARRKRREVLVEDSEPFEVPVPAETDAEDVELQRLYEGIAQLKPDAAEILILRYMHGKSNAEIAKMLGRSQGAITLILFRARGRLKKLLRTNPGDKP
jgi:RNA polymerase sigma-70 factor (ECF subfamily)